MDVLIIAWFCLIDEGLQVPLAGKRLRECGPYPTLADSEVLTMEIVGEYLGLEQDSKLFAYFRHHYAHFFPALALPICQFTRAGAAGRGRLWP